jgi:hypothetical protein
MKESFVAGLALAFAIFATPSQAQTAAPVKNFDVFVDPPAGFVFVKLPASCKFVGKLDASELKSLPDTVLTALLTPEPADQQMARDSAGPP